MPFQFKTNRNPRSNRSKTLICTSHERKRETAKQGIKNKQIELFLEIKHGDLKYTLITNYNIRDQDQKNASK